MSLQVNEPTASSRLHFSPSPSEGFPPHQDRRRPPCRELVAFGDDASNSFKLFAAQVPDDHTRAHHLVERRYAWRGYALQPAEERARSRITISALQGHSTVATLTTGLDGPQGLYVEKVYPDCVRPLRDEGRRLCEFTRFAVDESVQSQQLLGAIFHVACIYALALHDCTDALIEVNPRHVRFYERMLGFTQAAEQRLDPTVNAPAVLMQLDLAHSSREIDRLAGGPASARKERSFYPYFFDPATAEAVLGKLRLH